MGHNQDVGEMLHWQVQKSPDHPPHYETTHIHTIIRLTNTNQRGTSEPECAWHAVEGVIVHYRGLEHGVAQLLVARTKTLGELTNES